MSGQRKPSHPILAHGVLEVVEELMSAVPVGSQYGFFSCVGAIAVGGPAGANPRDVALKLTTNTSQANLLAAKCLYSASVRLIKREGKTTYTAYYTPKQPFNIGPATEASSLVNQVTISGLGIVVSREEIVLDETGDNILSTAVRHTDWDSEARKPVSFDVMYFTLKKGPLANSFGLFQIGREVYLTGVIVDWDEVKKTWIVQKGTVSVTSGHQNLKVAATFSLASPKNDSSQKRKLVEYNTVTSQPARKLSTSSVSTSSFSLSNSRTGSTSHETLMGTSLTPSKNSDGDILDSHKTTPVSQASYKEANTPSANCNAPEEGEELELKDDTTFQNTYPKKRTPKDIIGDARKSNNGKL